MDHDDLPARTAYARARITDAHGLISALVAGCAMHEPAPALPEPVTAEAINTQVAYAEQLAATTLRTGCTCGSRFFFGSDVPRVAGERYGAFLTLIRTYPRRPDTLPAVRKALWEVAVWAQAGGFYPVQPDFTTAEPPLASPPAH